MANACCWWGSSRQELQEHVHDEYQAVQNMWDSCFPPPCPSPSNPSSWKWSTCELQTVLRLLWKTNAFLETFVTPMPYHYSSEPIWLCNYQPFHFIHGSIQYSFEAVNTSRNSFFPVKVSLKCRYDLKTDDNKTATLCVLQVMLRNKNGWLSWNYEHRWISSLAAQCARSCVWGQRCDITDA